MPSILYERQTSGSGNDPNAFDYPYDGYDGDWWWSPTGMAVRYAIIAVLFALVLLYFVGGYWHAKRRISKNLAPLPYHRWMVNRRRYQPANQQWYNHQPSGPYNTQQPYYQNNNTAYGASYGMQGYAPPPPAYDAHMAPPPVYQPPQGGSKVAADQHYAAVPGGRSGESSDAAAAPAPPARDV